ncbi:hypothetical protein HYALB_00000018 [Hymenoscyphus albidus]|uniref:cellulase n=1 Tax=Hymenoscyphus albidus TaxID=595503 RepID=A0A9N9LI94_9HELO|nr:hypothetical protein HYALB_00000018 [Hymenoscyphus albidus]
MRFSTTILAAGLTATTLAAPIVERDDSNDDCGWVPTHVGNPGHAVNSTSTVLNLPSPPINPGGPLISIETLAPQPTTVIPQPSRNTMISISVPSETAPSEAVANVSAVLPTAKSSGKFKFFGVNEAGAEFGETVFPGIAGKTYQWPSTASIGTLMSKGMNTFRIPFLLERMTSGSLNAKLDTTYLSDLKKVVSFITEKGGYAVIDAHNYGRYHGNIITSTADFKTFWGNLAKEFAGNEKTIFDCNNEFHDMENSLVAQLDQACIDGIRGAGASKQYIFVEGNVWTSAGGWVKSGNGDSLKSLTDPSNKIIYEMHQYLDPNSGGKVAECASTTIGKDSIIKATAWLKENGKKGVIGGYAGGANSQCKQAVMGMLDAMVAANDVWMGALWWGGGALWKDDYVYKLEPPSGQVYEAYIDLLGKYA